MRADPRGAEDREPYSFRHTTPTRHTIRQSYLLRALVSCGQCHWNANARFAHHGYPYYTCRGRKEERCTAPYIPASALDAVVWQDLCQVLSDPAHIAAALTRARGGAWLPQDIQARQRSTQQARAQVQRQQQRLLDAYLAGVVPLAELDRKRQDLLRRDESLEAEQRQLEAIARRHLDLRALATSMEAFCAQVRAGLDQATFTQRRTLVELLIDRVIVTGHDVEIRYVMPTDPTGPHQPFCHLRLDYRKPALDQRCHLRGGSLALTAGTCPANHGRLAQPGPDADSPQRHHRHRGLSPSSGCPPGQGSPPPPA